MKDEIKRVLGENSDFAFEMRVVRQLLEVPGCNVEHSGVYQDSITGKIRQFDIRGGLKLSREEGVFFAIECKNLATESPLVIHMVPRNKKDQGLWCIYHGPFLEPQGQGAFHIHSDKVVHEVQKIEPEYCRYHRKEMVGKGMDRLVPEKDRGRLAAGDRYKRDDSEVYEKMSQALASLEGMIRTSGEFNRGDGLNPKKLIFIPVLVVPKDTLWTINYDADGRVVSDPQPVSNVALYQNRMIRFPVFKTMGVKGETDTYPVSHLEIVTIDSLSEFIDEITGRQGRESRNIFGRQIR